MASAGAKLRRWLRRHQEQLDELGQFIGRTSAHPDVIKPKRKITGAVRRGLDRQFRRSGTRDLALV